MRKYILGLTGIASLSFCLTFISFKSSEKIQPTTEVTSMVPAEENTYENHINSLYTSINLEQAGLSASVFEKAVTGFYNLKKAGKLADKSILTVVDFDQKSTKKRLYIIDLQQRKLIMNTWVAHGQNTGSDEAQKFSNLNNSYASSLGFYVTAEVYRGAHGRSLKLDGMDIGFNDQARSRAIVVHGAKYVSEGTINALGRLGRSHGCPAVASELSDEVIDIIGGKTVLFINKSVDEYSSKYLNEAVAANFAISDKRA